MAPTSGGQYHWVSEIAPKRVQKQMSYVQIVALISVCQPSYASEGWQVALITIASAVAAITLSVYVMQRLTLAEGLAVVTHCFGFVAFLAILWVMGPKTSAKEVWTHFEDDNGWGSTGAATLVGIIGPVASFIGGDSAVHLAEELQDASYVLPRAMVTGCAINYILGLVGLISFLSNLGPIDDSLYVYGGQPWVAVIYRITGSKAATIIMILVIAVCFFCLQMNCVMTSSRQLWAFARDKGVPFHGFLSQVTLAGLPRNAVVFTLVFSSLLSLVIVGSSVAFNVFLSFGNAGIMTSYVVIIGCIIYRRFDGNMFPPTKFSLGKAGLFVNTLAFSYLLVALTFTFFPSVPNPRPAEMNWASLMYGFVLLFALVWYRVRAKTEYDGPVEYVRKDV
ncbi:hypothetical protein LTR22_017373 [Elasticomyces elasticus]|nr:hypothetical protein LTR22_017373 [Elasticomyces elasticus]